MIRRLLPLLVTAAVVGTFAWTLLYLHKKSQARPIVYATAHPARRDIIKKTVAPGALVPRREIAIKPRVSGVVERLYVEPGMHAKRQALLAKIQIVPFELDDNGQLDEKERFYTTKSDLTVDIADGRYPAPPARDLYLVTLGAPDGLTRAFIEWVLTDGQAYVEEVGYIHLGQAQLQEQLEKLQAEGQ